ncbi:hypothetical protein V2W45_833057 [Cenococcum geophilum]
MYSWPLYKPAWRSGGRAVKATNSARPSLLEQRGKSGAEGIAVLILPVYHDRDAYYDLYLGTFPSARRLICLNCRSGWWVRAQTLPTRTSQRSRGNPLFLSACPWSCAGGHLTSCFDKLKGHADQRAPAKHTYCLIGIVGLRVIAPKTSLGKPCRFVSLHAPKKPVVYKYITGCRRHADDLRSSHPTSRAFALYALKCFQCPPLSPS